MNTKITQFPKIEYGTFNENAPNWDYDTVSASSKNVISYTFNCPQCGKTHTLSFACLDYALKSGWDTTDYDKLNRYTSGAYWTDNDGEKYASITLILYDFYGSFEAKNVLHLVYTSGRYNAKRYSNVVLYCPVTNEPICYKESPEPPEYPEPPEPPEDVNPTPTPPPDFKDEPPKIWGYTTVDIEDVSGYANSPISIIFRAWDDIGISRFYYSLKNEHEIEEVDILKPVSPTKYGDYTYKFDIVHSLTGNYQYKIVVFDTAGQRTDSNTFSVIVEPSLDKPIYSPVPPPVSDSDYIVLYDKKENNFTHNGIGTLDNDVIECLVDNKENEAYELTLKYLITGKYIDELLDIENIIKCKTNPSDEVAQLFRIYDSEYIMNENVVVVKAQHISYDLKDEFVESINLVGSTCEQATQTLMSKAIGKSRFVVESNIGKISNFKQERVNVLEAIVGIENSIFEVYGNNNLVISRNNFNYSINKQIDDDKGVVIAYSKNILGLRRTININEVTTCIYPYAFSRTGACLRLSEKIIYSKNIGKYGTYKIKAIDFTSDTVNDEESLRNACSDYFNNGCDIPKINYDVDFVSLYSNSSNREKYNSLEIVRLGETVTVQDSKIGLSVKARVIRTIYNALKKRYEKIELGNFKNEYRISRKNEINNLKKVVRSLA